MNEPAYQHAPSPEFRASLEREVVHAFRRQSQFSAPASMAKRARLRTAAALMIGLLVGVGGAVATAQVQGAKVRDSLALTAEINRKLAVMKLELAQEELELVSRSVKVGVRPEGDLDNARINVMSAEFAIKRLDLAFEEMKLTGRPARDELWAPLVGQRDFVSQRLYFDAVIGGQQLYRAEAVNAEVVKRARLGVIDPADTLESSGAVERASAELRLLSQKKDLRTSFLDGKLSEQEISQKLQVQNLQREMTSVMTKLREASERAKRAKKMQSVGISTVVDVKRAELDSLESAQAVERVRAMLLMSQSSEAMRKAAESLRKAKDTTRKMP